MKFLNPRTLLSLSLLLPVLSFGGSGWVGNSPVLISANDASYSLASHVSSVGHEESAGNPLLLRDGESRLMIGFGKGGEVYSGDGSESFFTTGVLGFDYGLSDNWTLLNLTALGYNIREGGEDDHSLALYFGLIGSSGWSSWRGFEFAPGVGLLHAYEHGNWRFTNALHLSGAYHSKKSEFFPDYNWDNVFIRLRINVSRRLGEKWSLGVGAESLYGEYTRTFAIFSTDASGQAMFSGWSGIRKRKSGLLLANPSLSVSRQLTDKGTLTVNLGFNENGGTASESTMGSYLVFSTKW